MVKQLSLHQAKNKISTMGSPVSTNDSIVCFVTYKDGSGEYMTKTQLCKILRQSIIANNFITRQKPKNFVFSNTNSSNDSLSMSKELLSKHTMRSIQAFVVPKHESLQI